MIPILSNTQDNNVPAFVRTIDKTTYIVKVHFKEEEAESLEDKIKRMLKKEVENM